MEICINRNFCICRLSILILTLLYCEILWVVELLLCLETSDGIEQQGKH